MHQLVRLALATLFVSLACSACAMWEEPIQMPVDVLRERGAPTPLIAASMPAPPRATTPQAVPDAIPLSSEEYACMDGAHIQVRYSDDRNTARVSVNASAAAEMRRQDDGEIVAYRAGNTVLRRASPRAALAIEPAAVTVQPGDTLGLIATRIYGDRMRAFDIARTNGIANPDLIYPGQVLNLPQVVHMCRRILDSEMMTALAN